jgi:hypothetical protein
VYILDCALRPANRDWLTPQELTMTELIYLHDAFSMVMAALVTSPYIYDRVPRIEFP